MPRTHELDWLLHHHLGDSAAANNASTEIIRALFEYGADATIATHFGESPVQLAQRCGNKEAASAIEVLSAEKRQETIERRRDAAFC